MKKTLLTVLAALAVGFTSGFFGGGGGMLLVPLLEKGLKEKTKTAHATAVMVMLPICLASGVIYFLKGSIKINEALTVSAGVLAGGILGALLLKKLPAKITSYVFAIIMLAAAVKLIFFP